MILYMCPPISQGGGATPQKPQKHSVQPGALFSGLVRATESIFGMNLEEGPPYKVLGVDFLIFVLGLNGNYFTAFLTFHDSVFIFL